ncbi:uncharacterized protein SPSK_00851 [Sporothrix schenckii 1099-18]|uniref:Uncharacterized protein n=1 Tax=Sporothrix schenckii 1099-18 TaxID=1397361 RepID=A0A0F2LW80_SPOSC|nr:uncharacterized protein SPSK_00851 [Sporothrix schenckii 1099-18]KJR81713.1 hypothetical protein SPSK_00851 [Sporothrix schenckii 1099-18]
MPIRNPFARRTAADEPALRPGSADVSAVGDLPKQPSFERVDTVGSMASSSTSMRSRRSQDTGDYKMSVVNDSGVYLPPSPTSERDAFWSTSGAHGHGNGHRRTYITSLSSLSRSSTDNHSSNNNNGNSPTAGGRSSLGDIEPFSISRESFDSYRRSFDISAKSPVVAANEWGSSAAGRQSLDSSTFRRNLSPGSVGIANANANAYARPSRLANDHRFPPADEGFEEVGLDDGRQGQAHAQTTASHATPTTAGSVASNFIRKRGAFFSKFGSDHTAEGGNAPLGRKRAPSGQGAELTPMDRNTSRPLAAVAAEPQEAQ